METDNAVGARGRVDVDLPRARWARPHGNARYLFTSAPAVSFRAHDGRGLMETRFCSARLWGDCVFRAHDGRGLMETVECQHLHLDVITSSARTMGAASWKQRTVRRRRITRAQRPSARTMGAASWKRILFFCTATWRSLKPSARTMGAASWKRKILLDFLPHRWPVLPRARWARPHGNGIEVGNWMSGVMPLPRARWARPHGNDKSMGTRHKLMHDPSARTMGAASWKREWPVPRSPQKPFRAHDGRGVMETACSSSIVSIR